MTDFRSAKKVHEHLESQGYDVALRTVQLHVKQGKLVRGEGRRFTLEAVRQYAGSYLTAPALTAQTGEAGSKEKLVQEQARRMKAVADQEEIRVSKLRGELIEKSDVDRRIAYAASMVRASMNQYFQEKAPEIVELVEGNPKKTEELIEFLLGSVLGWCRAFSKEEYEIEEQADSEGYAE